MGHSNRGRLRSAAQKAGMSAYNNDSQYVLLEELPVMQKFVDSSNNVIDTYYGGNPTASDVNLLLQTEDEVRAKLFAEYHNAYTNRLNPIPYAERQVDTNPFGPYNYPSDSNGYGILGGYNAANSYPSYDSMSKRNPGYTVPTNVQVQTSAPRAGAAAEARIAAMERSGGVPEVMQRASTPFYSEDMHHRLLPRAMSKYDANTKKALRAYVKQNGYY